MDVDECAEALGKPIRKEREGKREYLLYRALKWQGNIYKLGDPVLVWSDESLSKTDNDSQEEPVINDEPVPFICIIREIRQQVRAYALAPVEVVGQWMYSFQEISDDRRKFHGFSRSSCSSLPYNEQELVDRRLLFYSFHTDPFDAEAIAGKCTIHMLPRAKGFPKEEEAGGFVVHFVYRHMDGRIVAVDDRSRMERGEWKEVETALQETRMRLKKVQKQKSGNMTDLTRSKRVREEGPGDWSDSEDEIKAVKKSNPGKEKDDSGICFKRLRKMKLRVVIYDEEEQQGLQEMQESEEDIGGGELDEDNSRLRNTHGGYPGDYLWNRRSRDERLDEVCGAGAATTKQHNMESVEEVRGEAAERGAVKRSASFGRVGKGRGGKDDGRNGAVALGRPRSAERVENVGKKACDTQGKKAGGRGSERRGEKRREKDREKGGEKVSEEMEREKSQVGGRALGRSHSGKRCMASSIALRSTPGASAAAGSADDASHVPAAGSGPSVAENSNLKFPAVAAGAALGATGGAAPGLARAAAGSESQSSTAAEILERAGCCTGIRKRDHMLELLLSALLSATSSSPCASPRASVTAAAAAVPTISVSAAAIPTVDSSAPAVPTDSASAAAPDSCIHEKKREWEMKAAKAVADLEELANEKLGDGVGSRYTVKLRSVRANFKSGNCLSRRFVLGELSPSVVLSMSPEELKVIVLVVPLPPASICS
ncbi:unnamed protein product [Closterium sp. NIES-53]